VFPAGDGKSGVNEFDRRQHEVSLVITDMMLPDTVGTQLVKQLRKRRSDLPVIAISGMMESGDFDELLRMKPAVECLAKPLTPSTLLSAVRRGIPTVAK
jgi:CheY-like chemotaxis protein